MKSNNIYGFQFAVFVFSEQLRVDFVMFRKSRLFCTSKAFTKTFTLIVFIRFWEKTLKRKWKKLYAGPVLPHNFYTKNLSETNTSTLFMFHNSAYNYQLSLKLSCLISKKINDENNYFLSTRNLRNIEDKWLTSIPNQKTSVNLILERLKTLCFVRVKSAETFHPGHL